MKYRNDSNRVFRNQQHKFRGMVSEFKSHKFSKGRTRATSAIFRSSLRELFLDSRVTLHPSQFGKYLDWVNHHIDAQLPELGRMDVGYEDLSGVITWAPEASLEREIAWIAERIKASSKEINDFLHSSQKIERLVFSGDFESAICGIQAIESEMGASIWGVQLRLALEQLAGGLERQKRYNNEVKSVYRRGLLAFITSLTSVRNEDKTTLSKYISDTKLRIENHKYYEPFVKTYLRYRLVRELPDGDGGIADVLRVEQSHSLIDIYETFVSIIQEVARREDLSRFQEVISKCIAGLAGINDYRLTKANLIMADKCDTGLFGRRITELSDALFDGDAKRAAFVAKRCLRSAMHVDPWHLIYAGFAFGHSKRARFKRYDRPQDIPHLIGRIQSRCESSFESIAILSKLVANLSGLPTAVGIIDFLQQIQRTRPDDDLRPWLIGLNSPSIGVEDLHPNKADWRISSSNSATEAAWWNFYGFSPANVEGKTRAAQLFCAARFVRENQYLKAIDLIKSNHKDLTHEPLRTIAISILLHASYAAGDRQSVIELIAEEGARGESYRQLLPVQPSLENYQWADYKLIPCQLSASVALHLLWSENESEETASLLRFSTRQFLKDPAIQVPSKICDVPGKYPTHQLIYFLSRICVPNILDVSSSLRSSSEVMEERQRVCAALRVLDEENADLYEQEISLIAHQQAMDDGQWIVDRTRIHVDKDALARWASKDLSEAYSRFRDLLEVNVGEEVDIDELLKDAIKDALSKHSSFSPETEADALLINILGRVGEEFLNNPRFGLDFYLSKRIRHQSFIGRIRGPVEFSKLITTRESEAGGYHPNTEWVDKFTKTNDDSKLEIIKAFSKFSARFDDALIAAKERRFHIRTQEQPLGLLYIELSPRLIFFVREFVRIDEKLSDFINTAIAVLWAALDPSLVQARRFITNDLKNNAVEAFDELRATVKKLTGDTDPAFLELDLAIGRCSSDVQRAFDDAAQWFTRADDARAFQRSFELEQMVSIAIESALKCHRSFEPIITKRIFDGDIRLSAGTLIFVHDVLFVALGNIHAHSGLKKPKVSVHAHVNSEEETFSIEVKSENKSQNRATTEKRLDEIRELISAGAFERRTRKEGGSGFLKLAAVVHQSPKGSIDFGINEAGEFQLKVVYSLILQALPADGNHE